MNTHFPAKQPGEVYAQFERISARPVAPAYRVSPYSCIPRLMALQYVYNA
jgi:hypothetical protein